MVGLNGEKPHVVPIAAGCRAAGLRYANGVDRAETRNRIETANFFPLETLIPISLRPGELADFSQRIGNSIPLRLVQL